MAEIKTKKSSASVEAFLDTVENEQRRADAKQLLKIFKAATRMKPVMWGTSIVGFGCYHYKSERSTQEGDWPLAAFSPRKVALTVYLLPGFKEYAPLLKKLGPHKIAGACLYLKRLSDIDVPTLTMMIKMTVREMQKRYPTSTRT